MNMQNSGSENKASLEALYYIKIIYPKCIQMAEFAYDHFNHPLSKKIDHYYKSFTSYILSSASINKPLDKEEMIEPLPNGLDYESVSDLSYKKYDWEIKANVEYKKVEAVFLEHGANEFPLPAWLNEAIRNIDEWLLSFAEEKIQSDNSFYILEQQVKQANTDTQGKIIIESNGDVAYLSPTGKIYKGTIKVNKNAHKLLQYLASNIGKIFSTAELGNQLNLVRQSAEGEDSKRRVTDTIKSIRDSLKLAKDDDIFLVNNGYGLKYPVVFKA